MMASDFKSGLIKAKEYRRSLTTAKKKIAVKRFFCSCPNDSGKRKKMSLDFPAWFLCRIKVKIIGYAGKKKTANCKKILNK